MKSGDLRLNKVAVKFTNAPIDDITGTVKTELMKLRGSVTPGMSISVAVGSRGIANIALIAKAAVDTLIEFGAKPFIVPAMGSHGGATAEGQREILAEYGISEATMGVPVCSSMEVVKLGELPGEDRIPVYMDKFAYESDRVLVINRVKAHTDFHGPNESGIAKMLSIGLGKHAQAIATHEYLVDGLRKFIPAIARFIADSGKLLGALALVEDGYDQTSIIEAVTPGELVETDARLLIKSKAMMPAIPFDRLDVLLVDRCGKNISGTIMDTNIIGRMGIAGETDGRPYITTLCLFDIAEESHGNAAGFGLADLIPRRLYNKIDWQATYENVITSRFLRRGATPIVLETDRQVVDTALSCCGHVTEKTLKLVRIKDTLHIGEMYISDALLAEAEGNGDIEVLERNAALVFSEDGRLMEM